MTRRVILLKIKKKVIPAFDLYIKEVGDVQGYDRITTLANRIRTSPEHLVILKILLCQFSNAKVLNLKFIPYGLDRQTNERTIREIIIQQNIYFVEMAIIQVTGITKDGKEELKIILYKSLYITGIKSTRKSHEERRNLLLTTNTNKSNAQRETNNLLGKYYKKNEPQWFHKIPKSKTISIYINEYIYVRSKSSYLSSLHECNPRP